MNFWEFLQDRRFMVLAEIFVFNVTILLWIRPPGFFPQPKTPSMIRLMDIIGVLSLALLLLSSFWTAVVINR